MESNEYLLKFFQAVKDLENLDLFAGTAKLSRTEFRLLREVITEQENGREVISSELARRLGVTRSAVSQIVTKMEKEGIVQRVAAPNDKKIAYVRLAPRAHAAYEAQCRCANTLMERVVGELGESKMDALVASYREFIAVLRKVLAEAKEEKKD